MMKIKCIDNKGNKWFTTGKDYRVWYDLDEDAWSDSDVGVHVCHGTLSLSAHGEFEMVEEEKQHPHADLMLKYAMIAQYDDKPWESFEVRRKGTVWDSCNDLVHFSESLEYRLKPQEPKIQVGQVWVSKEGVEVTVDTPSDKNTIYFKYHLGGLLIKNSVSFAHFIKNFKRKENN